MHGARAIGALLLMLPVATLIAGGLARRWLGDDGFINVRVVKQLLAGNGFVYNSGERVEAVTSPLWVLLLTLGGATGARIEDVAIVLGVAFSALGMCLASLACIHGLRVSGRSAWFLPVGALVYSAIPAAWDYVTSGLENGLGLFWLGAASFCVVRAASGAGHAQPIFAGLVVGFGPVVRPDYLLLGAPLGMILIFAATSRRVALQTIAFAAGPSLLWQVFRMGYYAALVPNTALAKEAFESRWEQGWHYLDNTVLTYGLAGPLAAVAAIELWSLIRIRRLGSELRTYCMHALFFGGVLHGLYVIRVGGDYMHARMLLPSLFAVLMAVSFVRVDRPLTVHALWPIGTCLAALCWSATCALLYRVPQENEFGIGDERGWHARMSEHPNPVRLEDYERFFFYADSVPIKAAIASGCQGGEAALVPSSTAPCARVLVLGEHDQDVASGVRKLPLRAGILPRDVVAVVSMPPLGIAGNFLDLRVNLIDPYGLADPVASRLELGARGRPGHEKYFGAVWLAAKYAEPDAVRHPLVAAARAALACPELAALGHATREELSFGRFFENMKLSFALHRLRIPDDPSAARDALCPRTSDGT